MGIAVPSGARPLNRPRLLGLVAGAAVAVGAIALVTGHDAAKPGPQPLPKGVNAAGLLDATGARVVRVTKAGDGGLIDVRYQIVDSDKAAALHSVKRPPALVDEHSGMVISRLLMGHAHAGTFHNGEVYFFEFEDPAGLVQPGDPVSVVLGPVRLMHVKVQ